MKISVQLYTLRDSMNADPAGTLKALGKLGYRYVELAGTAGKTAKEFAAMLKDAGLKASGMHVGLEACEKDLDAVLADAEAVGAKYIIVPWIPESAYKDGWDKAGVRLQAIGEKVSKAKRVFGYHNHTFEFQDAGGRTGYDALFEAMCPDQVKNEIDLWWAHCGGQDPAKLVAKYGERVDLVHLKDGKDCKDSTQTEAGNGAIKWDEVLKACDKAKVEYGVVELDNCPRPPIESVKICLDYFRSKGYKD